MKKLQNKTFILIAFILTLFLLTILIIFNISIYNNELKEIKDKIIRVANTREKVEPEKETFKNPLFMDLEVYVVSFDQKENIIAINSYVNDGLSNKEIMKLVNENFQKTKIDTINNMYLNDYVFFKNLSGDFIIINNYNVRQYLITNIYKSIIIFILLEIIILYISYILTKWIVKPVRESFDKQKQFIYDASHELKTPLAIIMASAESLEDNPKEKKWLNNIKSESERMNKLVIDLLELSKSEDIKNNKVFNEINLSKIIKNKALSFESLMYEEDLTLDFKIEKDIMFRCDEEKIKELLSILIDNAIKHGYKKSKIEIELLKTKDIITLSVKNRGDSIPEEERTKIFERFYRGDKSRNRNQNRYGLGLAIAKNIAENHQGNISVNCLNGYTTFKVEFKTN